MILDSIRNKRVLEAPEEIVRQTLIQKMVKHLGYPKCLIAVEKDLNVFPHLKNKLLPKRRCDIICFGKDIHRDFSIYPLLIIECKAHKLNKKAFDQIIGYNHIINSFFIAIANFKEIKTFWYNGKDYESINYLPNYEQLLKAIYERKC